MISRRKNKTKAVKAARKINRRYKKKSARSGGKIKNSLHHNDERSNIKLQTINNKLSELLKRSNLHDLAVKTKFLIRESKITPFIFLYALSMGVFGIETSLDLLAINMNTLFGTNLTGQAFSLRLSQKKSAKFLKSFFEALLKVQMESSFESNYSRIFSMFSGVILEDSTNMELNKRVAKSFKGSGGCASKSALKLNWVFNICSYTAIAVDLFPGNKPDQKHTKNSLKYLKKEALLVRDLGYFTIESLKTIIKKQAYYLSRLRKGMCMYLNKDDLVPLAVDSFFRKITRGNRMVKMPIFIGREERFATTLFMQKVPQWVLNKRIKYYKKRNSGKSPSNEFMTWAKYSVYISNIPDEFLKNDINDSENNSYQIVMEIYRIRWQIELLFKSFKSGMKIHVLKGKNASHIRCAVYGKLVSLILSLMILSYSITQRYKGREVSLWKVTRWLTTMDRLAKAVLEDSFDSLYFDLLYDLKLLCKDKRNRKTSLGIIEEIMQLKRDVA